LANVHYAAGAYDEAKALYERALAIWEKALGPEHPGAAYSLDSLAQVALAQHRPADAITYAERAVSAREAGDAAAELVAKSRFLLARALWGAPAGKSRDRDRARALAVAARDAYRGVDGKEEARAEVEAWLTAHSAER